mmetsp:Transcript_172154/g.551833  ORF Transcript_172154/g.551833 Transcript_172154/m.551833 type:complete len:445 (-) Transcript_172154:28-1362(-)
MLKVVPYSKAVPQAHASLFHRGQDGLVPRALDVALVLAQSLVLGHIPHHVLLQLVSRGPTEYRLGLVGTDTEARLTERELAALGELLAFQGCRVVVNDGLADLGRILACGLGTEVDDLDVGHKHVRGAVEDLALGLGLLAHDTGQHRGRVLGVRQRREAGAVARHQDGRATGDAVQEPIEVFGLVRLRAVNVLRTEGAPSQASISSRLLEGQLLVILLDISSLQEGPCLDRLVHAAGTHVGIGLRAPCCNRLLHVLGADVLVVEDVIARPDALHGAGEGARLGQGRPFDLDTRSLQVRVAVKGRLGFLRSAVVNHRHLEALVLGELQSQVVAQLAVATALVLHDERCAGGRHREHSQHGRPGARRLGGRAAPSGPRGCRGAQSGGPQGRGAEARGQWRRDERSGGDEDHTRNRSSCQSGSKRMLPGPSHCWLWRCSRRCKWGTE